MGELKEDQKELIKQLRDKKKRLAEVKRRLIKHTRDEEKYRLKLREIEERNKIKYFNHPDKGYLGRNGKWELNPIQKQVVEAVENPSKRVILMAGANQIGKTLTQTCIVMGFLRGYWPWENVADVGHHLWEARGWKPPISIRWVGHAWEGHVQKVLIEKGLEEFWPNDWPKYTKKNNLGIVHIWRDETTKNEVQIMSTNQASKEFEGWTGHLSVFDEPAPRDIWIATQRGLIANKGLAMMGATLISEGWITSDIINRIDEKGQVDKSVSYFTADIYVNEGFGLDKEGIEIFSNQLNDQESEARIKGVPSFMSTMVLQMDKDTNLIERFDIPSYWMIDVAIDIGIAKPHDVLFLATDEKGLKYVVFEEEIRGTGTDIGEAIIRKINRYNLRVNRVICDPLAKADQNNENSVWERIDLCLNRHALYLEPGSKDKEDGIIAINNYFKTINQLPALFIFEDCLKTIRQVLNWVRDKDTGKPLKKDDDQCENLYRLMLLETVWEEIQEESPEPTTSNAGKDALTGY